MKKKFLLIWLLIIFVSCKYADDLTVKQYYIKSQELVKKVVRNVGRYAITFDYGIIQRKLMLLRSKDSILYGHVLLNNGLIINSTSVDTIRKKYGRNFSNLKKIEHRKYYNRILKQEILEYIAPVYLDKSDTEKWGLVVIGFSVEKPLQVKLEQLNKVLEKKLPEIKNISLGTKVIEINGVKIEMVKIPGGDFLMGSRNWEDDEKPVHKVKVDGFYIGKYEVTVEQFKTFIDETGYQTDANKDSGSWIWSGDDWIKKPEIDWMCGVDGKKSIKFRQNQPVIHVSWNDVVAYCQWLRKKTGNKFRLPTEAEWEYACRAGSKNKYKYYFGNDVDLLEEYEWFKENSENKTHPVGLKLPNGFGLYDMLGNVWEWCQDWYDEKYYRRKIFNNPKGPNFGDYRVNRGGSFGTSFSFSRITIRGSVKPNFRSHSLGFRVVMKKENK